MQPVKDACEKLNIRPVVTDLKAGDYEIGNILVETKTPFDFISSVLTTHLISQIGKLKATDQNVCIAVIGPGDLRGFAQQYKGTHHTDMTAVQIEAVMHQFVAETLFIRNLSVLFFQNAYDFVRFLKHANKLETSRIREEWIPKTGDPVIRAFGTPAGIGADMAKLLKEKYGTVARMIRASDADLQTVPKLGPKRLKAIRDTFGTFDEHNTLI